MDIRQLRAFVITAREGSLTEAATSLNTTLPLLREELNGLEQELGVSLFSRSDEGLHLTSIGNTLLESAQQVLVVLNRMRSLAAISKGELTGTLRVGSVGSAALLKLPQVLVSFSANYPNVTAQVVHGVSAVVRKQVRDGYLDCGFLFTGTREPALREIVLKRIGLKIVGPINWADRIRDKSWQELTALPWIYPPASCSLREVLDGIFLKNGSQPGAFMEASDEVTLPELVEKGVGMTVLRDNEARHAQRSGKICIWEGMSTQMTLSFCFLPDREHDPLIHAFASIVRNVWEVAA